jgi:hypothetical protein
MTVVGILWVVLTPYCTGLAVAWSRLANRLVTRHLGFFRALGWTALTAMFAGVFAIGGHEGLRIALASAPFIGLAVWTGGPGRDGDDPEPDPDDTPPAPDEIARPGMRVPAPPRRRPTGHPAAPRRSRKPVP